MLVAPDSAHEPPAALKSLDGVVSANHFPPLDDQKRAYRVDGKTTDRFPNDLPTLERAEPVYETLPGFDGDLGTARSLADLVRMATNLAELEEPRASSASYR